VRTGQVELEGIRAGLCRHLGQSLPVVLVVAAHDAGDHDLAGEVALDLGDAPRRVIWKLLIEILKKIILAWATQSTICNIKIISF